jgi:stearoyl-CoA desaturase (delta-9 desaturase)
MAQSINACCHLRFWGAYRNFATEDTSCNFWLLGLLALGEGWHNNHHAAPIAARHGCRAFEIDVTWQVIRLLERLGIAREVQRLRPPPAPFLFSGQATS